MEHSIRNRLVFYQLLYEPPEILVLDSPLYAMDEEMKRILLDCIQILKGHGTAILMCDANEQMLRLYCDQVIKI
jgi:ABC-type Mn2+/Zn2+ transport system ATPase subunit